MQSKTIGNTIKINNNQKTNLQPYIIDIKIGQFFYKFSPNIQLMKDSNINNESQVIMNQQYVVIKVQNHDLFSQNTYKSLKLTQLPPQEFQNTIKPNKQTHQVQQGRIPQTMKKFLKKRRITSQFLQNSEKIQQKKIRNSKKRFQDKNLIYQRANKQKKKAILQNKTLKSLQNTTQTLNNQIQGYNQQICKICEGKITKTIQKLRVFDCKHQFCAQCTKSYILFKIKMYEKVNCPNQNCKGNLNQENTFYCDQISLKQRKLYVKIHKFFQIHQSKGTKRLCPKEQCEGIIEIDSSSATNKCGICGFEICLKCFSQAHSEECEDYETRFVKENFNLVRCDKCKNFIEKSQGCHHIVCKCGNEFCEKCKEPWGKRHICKYTGFSRAVEGWGGCDWGITTKDHIKFLVKLPIKFLLIIFLTVAWTLFSFLGAPLNIALLLYWLYLLFIRPSIQKIRIEENCWKILVYIVFFPAFMFMHVCQGIQYFIVHIDQLLPQISNSYRAVIRL